MQGARGRGLDLQPTPTTPATAFYHYYHHAGRSPVVLLNAGQDPSHTHQIPPQRYRSAFGKSGGAREQVRADIGSLLWCEAR